MPSKFNQLRKIDFVIIKKMKPFTRSSVNNRTAERVRGRADGCVNKQTNKAGA